MSGFARQPAWWAPAIGHYRRLTGSQRAILDAVVTDLWRWFRPAPDAHAEISIPSLAARTGVSVRHVGRSIRALAADPFVVVELNPALQGHGILRSVDRQDTQIRVVQLRPWPEWAWRKTRPYRGRGNPRELVKRTVAAAEQAGRTTSAGETLALVLLDHLAWTGRGDGTEPAPLRGSAGFVRWSTTLEQLAARRWTEADVRAVLAYTDTDTDWRDKIRGADAHLELLHNWEGLLLRSRRTRG